MRQHTGEGCRVSLPLATADVESASSSSPAALKNLLIVAAKVEKRRHPWVEAGTAEPQ